MKIALKHKKSKLEKRFINSKEIFPFDISAWSKILPKTKDWSTEGEKKYYENGTVWIVENDILLTEIKTE